MDVFGDGAGGHGMVAQLLLSPLAEVLLLLVLSKAELVSQIPAAQRTSTFMPHWLLSSKHSAPCLEGRGAATLSSPLG